MKKIGIQIIALTAILCSCRTTSYGPTDYTSARTTFQQSISAEELKDLLYVYASDEFEGRGTGTNGQKKAVYFLRDFYTKLGVSSPEGVSNHFQTVPKEYFNKKNITTDSENVLAYIKGTEFPDEVVVISAHLDHIGIHDGEINNGADDDGSGTVAILEIAEALQMASKKGFGPKRSVLFLHVTAEEIGLQGSRYYTENPVFPLANTVANVNIDMIGRVDPDHEGVDENYIYPIGSDMLSDDLHQIMVEANNKSVNINLDMRYNKKDDPNRFYYRSDHYNFAKNNIPVVFFFNGTHADYHKPSDTVEKINYPLLAKRTQLIYTVVWDLANRDQRITLKNK